MKIGNCSYFYAVNTIHFFKEDIHFRLMHREPLRKWIADTVRQYKCQLNEINYIFCSDKYLRKLNKQFLAHDYNTDIITFDNSTERKKISGDIFISCDRVKANAETFHATFNDELHRVMIHGVLHLLGYEDKSEKERTMMRKLEDNLLAKRAL